jgi:hypothetical protein
LIDKDFEDRNPEKGSENLEAEVSHFEGEILEEIDGIRSARDDLKTNLEFTEEEDEDEDEDLLAVKKKFRAVVIPKFY